MPIEVRRDRGFLFDAEDVVVADHNTFVGDESAEDFRVVLEVAIHDNAHGTPHRGVTGHEELVGGNGAHEDAALRGVAHDRGTDHDPLVLRVVHELLTRRVRA